MALRNSPLPAPHWASLCYIQVYRNDKVTLGEIEALSPSRIVLSPGPGHPSTDAGICAKVLAAWEGVSVPPWRGPRCRPLHHLVSSSQRVPILGVCMGLQVMYEAYGGTVAYAGEIMHGKASQMTHDGKGLFAGLPSPYSIVRYHSLAGTAESLPEVLEVTATTANGIIQAVRHKTHQVAGVQFHPESILTEHGMELLGTFCAQVGGVREASSA